MKKCVLVAVSLGVFGLLGCGRVPPAAIKAVAGAGQGAKVAPKAAGRVAGRVAPADAARPAREGDPWKERLIDVMDVMKEGAESGWMQPGGDDRKRR
jgi:hypothetical protein